VREVELALALSARDWADALHRFLVDHGGARVRLQLLGADEALSESFDVLIIDDICSFLTPRLVEQVRRHGRHVIGVYDPDEYAGGKDRLLDCGVDDVVEAGADPDEFLRVIGRLGLADAHEPVLDSPAAQASGGKGPNLVVVGAPVGGCGATEVAIAIAMRLARRHPLVVLIDTDEVAPSIAARLGLPLHPNLRSAIDAVHHRAGRLQDSLHRVSRLQILPGLADAREWLEVRPAEVLEVVRELQLSDTVVVANIGSMIEPAAAGDGGRFGISRAMLTEADHIVGVGLPSPVGVVRLLAWAAEVAELAGPAPVHLFVNRAPRSRYRRGEILEEVSRAVRPASLGFLPQDPAVTAAAWAGEPLRGGRFARGAGRLADRVLVP
jgi:MinD-like ATPase involved in chromosome partitioning or flagellar assembly